MNSQDLPPREKDPVQQRFLPSPPFHYSRMLAEEFGCDLAIPNGNGIGNILMFTRLVDDFAKNIGRRIKLLTAPLKPVVGTVQGEEDFPIWKNNPFVEEIINIEALAPGKINLINLEQDNTITCSHIIENILYHYNIKPKILKPALYLSAKEQSWAINHLSAFPRPIVCLHAGGTSSSLSTSPWFLDNWLTFIKKMQGVATFIQVGKRGLDTKELGIPCIETSLRELMSIIWAADAFVGFDSSPAHIATAFEVPSIVLWDVLRKSPIEEPHQPGFGASALTRWAYPQNKNFMLLGERGDEIVNLITHQLYNILALNNYQRHA